MFYTTEYRTMNNTTYKKCVDRLASNLLKTCIFKKFDFVLTWNIFRRANPIQSQFRRINVPFYTHLIPVFAAY